MPTKRTLARIMPFVVAGLLFTLTTLLVIPATSQAIFRALGFETGHLNSPAYNNFEPFVPYVPGYFPEDFDITHVSHGAHLSTEINTYTETYASDSHYFILIESQGSAVPDLNPDPNFLIQEQPARLTEELDLHLSSDDGLDLNRFQNGKSWTITVILNEIHIQVVTNLPRQEAIGVAEGLIPAICTSKPTPEG